MRPYASGVCGLKQLVYEASTRAREKKKQQPSSSRELAQAIARPRGANSHEVVDLGFTLGEPTGKKVSSSLGKGAREGSIKAL